MVKKDILTVQRAIEKRQAADESLRQCEENFRRSLDDSPLGERIITKEGETIYANRAIQDIFGCDSIEEWQTTPTVKRYTEQSYAEFKVRREKRRLDADDSPEYEIDIVRKDGEVRHLQVWRTRVFWNGKEHYHVRYSDITQIKQAQEERKRLLEEGQASLDELQRLSRCLVEAQEVERKDLASELHDRIGQNLTALSINLNIIHNQLSVSSGQQIVARLDDSLKLLEEMTIRVRDLMGELRPPVLDDYGLLAALRWLAGQFSDRTGVAAVLRGKELTQRLPLEVETGLFRIAQEALNNVFKHAHAKRMIITLKSVAGRVRLTIADDGVGFDPQGQLQLARQTNWGLITMRERAHAIGGDLHIESAPGKGTRLIVEVPKSVIPAKAGHVVTRSEASALTFSAIQYFQCVMDAGSSPA